MSRLTSIVLLLLFCAETTFVAHASQVCTADTGSDLQAVINQCTTGGVAATVVVQPNAVISVAANGGVITAPSNLTIRCETGAAIRETVASPHLFKLIGSPASNIHDVKIEGCILDGGTLASTGIDIRDATNVHIKGVTAGGFTGTTTEGGTGNPLATGTIITGAGWHHVEIEDSVFGFSGTLCATPGPACGWFAGNRGAIYVLSTGGGSDHISIHHNTCNGDASKSSSSGSGSSCFKLVASSVQNFQNQWIDVSHNQITVGTSCPDSVSNGCLGIELFSSTNDDQANMFFTIAENLVKAQDSVANNNAFCISLGGARFGSVTGNVVQDCQTSGIEVVASFVTVSNNALTNTGPISWDANALYRSNVVVSNNVIVTPVCRALFLIASGSNFLDTGTFANNIIRAPFGACAGPNAPAAAAIRIQGTTTNIFNVRIVGNTIQEVPASSNAIETAGGAQIQIENNRFVNNHGTGVNLGFAGGGVNFSVKDNFFNGEGVFVSNPNGNTTVISQPASNSVNYRCCF
jgi:hypothetical protein